MKRFFIMLSVLLLTFTLTSCSKEKDENTNQIEGLENQGILSVGMECAYDPFNWTETEKTDYNVSISNAGSNAYADGYDVQIAKIIARELGVKLKIFSTKWDGLIPSLNSGNIDIIIAGMSPTEKRKEAIDFTEGYYTSTHVILMRKDSIFKDAKTLSDFKGAKIAGQKGTLYADLVPQLAAKGAIEATPLDSVPILISNIKSKQIDGTIVEEPVAKGIVAGDPDLIYVKTTDKFDVAIEDVMVSIGTRKNSPLTARINEILETITEEDRDLLMTDAVNKTHDSLIADDLDVAKEYSIGERVLYPLTWLLDHSLYYVFYGLGKVITFVLPATYTDVFNEFSTLFWNGIVKTLYLALFGTIMGLVIACFLGVVRTIKVNKNDNIFMKGLKYVSNGIIKVYVTIFRGTPMIVQAMIIFFGLSKLFKWNPFDAAMLTVTINTAAYLTEVIKSSIENLDPGQMEGARALGFSYTKSLFIVVFPQALKNAMASIGNEFVINIKDTSVLNVIGCMEMYFVLNSVAGKNYFYLETMISGALIYLILTYTTTKVLGLIEKKLGAPTKDFTSSN